MIHPKEYEILETDGVQGIYDFEGADFYEMQLRVTDYCNYDCSYCHWKYGKHYDFNDIKSTISRAIENVNCNNFRIYFHGGEPTTHPKCRDIIDFIFTIKADIIVEFQTNLSVGKKYVQTLIDRYKDQKFEINVSYHDKFVKDFEKLKEKIDLIYNNNMLGKIDIMLEHHIDRVNNIIKNSKDLFLEPYKNKIELIHGFIDYKNSTNMYKLFIEKQCEGVYEENYKVIYEDGTTKVHDTNDLYQDGISFKGWICGVGKKYCILNGNGDFFMCCANLLDAKPAGNILKNPILFKIKANNYTKCKWDCCKGEFYIDKYKPKSLDL